MDHEHDDHDGGDEHHHSDLAHHHASHHEHTHGVVDPSIVSINSCITCRTSAA